MKIFLEGIEWNYKWKIFFEILEAEYLQYKEWFFEDRKRFHIELDRRANKERFFLEFSLRLGLEIWKEYKIRGISKEIYFDTFKDISLWTSNYFQKEGRLGLGEIEWIGMLLDLKVFRLGRLEYELGYLEKDIQYKNQFISKGTKVIFIHIPEGEPLTLQNCHSSLQQVSAFYKVENPIILCHSWLLEPALQYLLNQQSGIIDFQSLFEIIEVDYSYPQAEERVFGCVFKDKSLYPEVTRLQKGMKAFLLEGKKLGMGFGIIKEKKK